MQHLFDTMQTWVIDHQGWLALLALVALAAGAALLLARRALARALASASDDELLRAIARPIGDGLAVLAPGLVVLAFADVIATSGTAVTRIVETFLVLVVVRAMVQALDAALLVLRPRARPLVERFGPPARLGLILVGGLMVLGAIVEASPLVWLAGALIGVGALAMAFREPLMRGLALPARDAPETSDATSNESPVDHTNDETSTADDGDDTDKALERVRIRLCVDLQAVRLFHQDRRPLPPGRSPHQTNVQRFREMMLEHLQAHPHASPPYAVHDETPQPHGLPIAMTCRAERDQARLVHDELLEFALASLPEFELRPYQGEA